MTIAQAIAEIREIYKLHDQDAQMTDRAIYALIRTPATTLMRRQDAQSKLVGFSALYQHLEFEPLVEVDSVRASCLGAPTGCTFRRTRNPLPESIEGYTGPLLRSVSSLDFSRDCTPIHPTEWAKLTRQKSFKYNPQRFYWYSEGYLYFPNVSWEAVSLDIVAEFSQAHRTCDPQPDCTPRQDSRLAIPESLFAEIKLQIRNDLSTTMQIPSDPGQDNRHPLN